MFDFHILGLSSRSTVRIYIALYGFKLVSARYWRLKINKKSAIFVILQFFPFLTPAKSKKKDLTCFVNIPQPIIIIWKIEHFALAD